MAATLIGRAHVFGFATLAFGISTLSGYVSPKFESLSLTNNADFSEESDQDGAISAVVGNQRGIQCSFRFKPRATSGTNTLAQAILSAGLPSVCAGVTITGLSVIAFGGFTDAFNTNSGNTQPWLYDGNGSLEGVHDGIWTGTITLRRYLGITSATAIV